MRQDILPPATDIEGIWQAIREKLRDWGRREPMVAASLSRIVPLNVRFDEALAILIANKIGAPFLPPETLLQVFQEALDDAPSIAEAAAEDLRAHVDRNPASRHLAVPFLFFKGFQALQVHRFAHWLWKQDRDGLALLLQSRNAEVMAVDIHPAARIGRGVFIDHGTSIVIGETAVVGDNVSLLHEVTLGGTGKQSGDRHPKIGAGVLIGAGAKVLGNITIGEGAKIGAGSVVLDPVPPHTTVVGVPARVVGCPTCPQPALEMDHRLTEEEQFGNAGGQDWQTPLS